MKKILLSGLALFALSNVNAQKSVVLDNSQFGAYKASNLNEVRQIKKTRASTALYYNYISFLGAQEGIPQATLDANSSLFTMFPDSNVRLGAPNSAYGVSVQSIGQVLDPAGSVFINNFTPGDLVIEKKDAYTLDTIFMPASYVKVNNSVDTLIVSLVHSGGVNLPTYYFPGSMAQYGVDTVYYLQQEYTTSLWNNGVYQTNTSGGPAASTFKYILTNSDSVVHTAGSTSFKIKNIMIPTSNFAVPAGEKVSVSITYKPGQTWVPGDTVGHFNQFLFLSYQPRGTTKYVPYYVDDRNSSSLVTKNTSNGWLGSYIPALAFTPPASPYLSAQVHDLTYRLTCNTSKPLSINDASKNITSVSAYPNPANSTVCISANFGTNPKNVTVQITNAMGQVVKSNVVNAVSNSIKNIVNVSDLASGLYIYTITADGQSQSGKFSVN